MLRNAGQQKRVMPKYIVGIDEAGRAVSKRRASSYKYIIGIDEAGRGPLAGPMVIAAVAVFGSPTSYRKSDFLKGIRDSKKLTRLGRERWYRVLKKKAACQYVSVSARSIDQNGISRAAREAIARLLKKFPIKPNLVLLDGSLYAPPKYKQKTIIKGDEKIPLIAAASIIAKVTRDRKMCTLHKKYPHYNFAQHKGYGTRAHMAAIRRHGLSDIHRRSFCTRIVS
ncbi:MAG: Ribonuclease HII [Parcubacteria group bacterium GW2011_GWA1_47_9]|nr:MAG: Ribonuclease HII [Parcubacteria group bacterium GW2011_GWA1_47_9]